MAMSLSFSVFAKTVTWEAPTTRQDGKTLTIEELSHYNLYCDDVIVVEIPAVSSDGRYEVSEIELFSEYGTHPCTMTAVDTDGLESIQSNVVEVVWEPKSPSAPTIMLIIN
jgi:hypothetical protein